MTLENGLSISQVIVFDVNGISIFSKSFRESNIDHALLSAFFSAIRQFSASMVRGEIEGIKIGNIHLNFKLLPIGSDNLIFLMVSNGYSSNDADRIADKFAENFAIEFEQFLESRSITFSNFEANPNRYMEGFRKYYSPICDEVVREVTQIDTISLDIPVKVDRDVLKFLYDIILLNPSLAKLYEHGSTDLLIEIIQTYVHSDRFRKDIEEKYLK